MNLKGIYSAPHSETKENKFSSAIYGSFFKMYSTLAHHENLNK